jgi:hypothetical protein
MLVPPQSLHVILMRLCWQILAPLVLSSAGKRRAGSADSRFKRAGGPVHRLHRLDRKVYMYVHVCVCVSACLYVCVSVCVCVYTGGKKKSEKKIGLSSTHTHTHIHTYTHTHIHTYTHAHTHTYTNVQGGARGCKGREGFDSYLIQLLSFQTYI